MKTTIISLFTIMLISCNNSEKKLKEKDFLEKTQDLVLSENNVNQEYFFKMMLKNTVIEYSTTYLGNIINNKNDTLKFITTNIYSGNYDDSKGGDAIISIYNSKNQRKGYYYIGGAIKKSFKIVKNNLYLPIQDSTCNQTTILNFKDSIPKEIFINCTERGGDLYKYEME